MRTEYVYGCRENDFYVSVPALPWYRWANRTRISRCHRLFRGRCRRWTMRKTWAPLRRPHMQYIVAEWISRLRRRAVVVKARMLLQRKLWCHKAAVGLAAFRLLCGSPKDIVTGMSLSRFGKITNNLCVNLLRGWQWHLLTGCNILVLIGTRFSSKPLAK